MTAASFLRLLDPVSVLESMMIQSPASNNLKGNGFDLFSKIVLKRPGSRVVLPVWNYLLLEFSILISLESSLLKIFVVKSALEQRAKFRTSLNWP